MRQDQVYCSSCPYFKRGFVPGEGPEGAAIILIGEAPGQDEAFRSHRPFTGPAGRELDRFLKEIRVGREDIYITNLVKCNPPENEDPIAEVVEKCTQRYLMREVVNVNPEVIVTAGAVPLHFFLPGADMEMVWGIPQEVVDYPDNPSFTIFPLYHPALGLHSTRMLPQIEQGFWRLGEWLRGGTVWVPDTVVPNYKPITHYDIGDPSLVAIDTESTWDGEPLYAQVSRAEGVARLVYAEDVNGVGWVWGITERPGVLTIMHNALYDLGILGKMGVHPPHVVDTMVMAYLLGDLPQGLKPLAYRLCGMVMSSYEDIIGHHGQAKAREYMELASILPWPDPPHQLEFKDGAPHIKKPQNIGKKIVRALKDSDKKAVDLYERWGKMEGTEVVEKELGPMPQADLRDVGEDNAIHYACRDADATLRVYHVLKERIDDEGLGPILAMDMAVIPMVQDMQSNGILVDREEMTKVNALLTAKMEEEEREIAKLLGYHINPASPPQIATMLEKEGIQVRRRVGKSGQQSTSKEVLEPLRLAHPVIGHILDWGGYETLRSTFTEVLPTLIAGDGRIHTTIKTTRTATGRLAMANPNLQNIPVRSEEGRMIRNAFIASPGYVLLSFDYSQIEMRVLAHVSDDPVMLQVFLDGIDIHSATAANMFRIAMEDVDELRHRYPAKRVGFGVVYGISGQGLAIQMDMAGAKGWTADSCDDLITSWFRVYRGVWGFMEECKAFARRNGFITDMFGRRRLIPEIRSSSKKIVEEGLRYATNQPIQSGAQGVIKLAMARVQKDIINEVEPGTVRSLIQIHDDLLFEVKEEEVGWIQPAIQATMEGVVKLRIPTPVDPKMGVRWGSMKKAGG